MIYFDSDLSKSTNTVIYFDWKTVIYTYEWDYTIDKSLFLDTCRFLWIVHFFLISSPVFSNVYLFANDEPRGIKLYV
jgi:hypothetical protein